MGDADLPHQGMNGVPGDDEADIEDRLDELQENLQEELDILYEMFQVVEQRTNSLTTFAGLHRGLWETFMAFNILVVPVVLAMFFSYFTRDLTLTEDFMVLREIVSTSLYFCSAGLGIPLYLRSLWRMRFANKQEPQPSSRSLFYMLVEDDGEDGDIDSDQPRTEDSDNVSNSSEDFTDQEQEERNRFDGELVPPPHNLNPTGRNLIAPLNNPRNPVPAEINAPLDNPLQYRGIRNALLNNQNQTDRNAIPALSNLSMIARNMLPPQNNINMANYAP